MQKALTKSSSNLGDETSTVRSKSIVSRSSGVNLEQVAEKLNQDLQEEKLDQNEELAKLRANTSIEKTILGKTLPSSDQMPGNVANVNVSKI